MSLSINSKDEIIMRLVHYFVTEENYQPIVVNGVKNEIWLENLEAPYRIVRINSNYIHNDDQFRFDSFKVKNISKQIKKKTLSLKMKTLNILLDLNEGVNVTSDKTVETYKVYGIKDIRNDKGLAGLYPKLKTFTVQKENNLDLIVNITNDINKKTEKVNNSYERVFSPKKIVVTKALIVLNIVMFLISMIEPAIANKLMLSSVMVKNGEYWRLLTAAFLHADILHLFVNMYALNIIGTQIETFLGKKNYLIVYLFSAFSSSLMSAIITKGFSVGASGAIFGLLGCLLYFGYHYRLYFGSVLKSQIIPIILINLLIGFAVPMIDNAGHIGGLFGGIFISMAIGIGDKTDKSSRINGLITALIYVGFLLYILFFR